MVTKYKKHKISLVVTAENEAGERVVVVDKEFDKPDRYRLDTENLTALTSSEPASSPPRRRKEMHVGRKYTMTVYENYRQPYGVRCNGALEPTEDGRWRCTKCAFETEGSGWPKSHTKTI